MALNFILFVALSAFTALTVALEGLHLATRGLLQIRPAFVGNGIVLSPAHSFGHDPTDHRHLTPEPLKELYYSQEGHRPSFHGSKHGRMTAYFNLPTVVLDQSTHPQSVRCSRDKIVICFQETAFKHIETAWNRPEFYLITFHVGCGHEHNGQRSYFHASNPQFDGISRCATIATKLIQQEDAVNSGEIFVGTFLHPNHKNSIPVRGHVRFDKLPSAWPDADRQRRLQRRSTHEVCRAESKSGPLDNTVAPLGCDPIDSEPESIVDSPKNLGAFAGVTELKPQNDKNAHKELSFASMDGQVTDGKDVQRRALALVYYPMQNLDKRFWWVCTAFNAILSVVDVVAQALEAAVSIIGKVAVLIANVALVTLKGIALVFGVPFKHSYHEDFKFDFHLRSPKGSLPEIFEYDQGFGIITKRDELTSEAEVSLQCLRCGISADFSVEGHVAFSIQKGLTKGSVSFTNNEDFSLDLIFGLYIEKDYNEPIEGFKKQIGAYPLSPLTIPGIITLGPQVSISAAVDLTLQSQLGAEIALGGSLSISKGKASLDAVNKTNNGIEGLVSKFTPVTRFKGDLAASVEFGLPVALECGLDVLNGKFKQTVGLVNKPSVYVKAKVADKENTKCKGGVELLVGANNRIYVEAFQSWDYQIRVDELYEKSLGCITAEGNTGSSKPPQASPFKTVVQDLNGADISDFKPNISNHAANMENLDDKFGYRVIMSEDQTGIVVADPDGYIFLVNVTEEFDMSAPIGSANLSSNLFDIDVFQRVLTYQSDEYKGLSARLRFYNASEIPTTTKAA
ncbi:hypothetical protein GQ53DRAFT_819421 [Thozetella sp. PMI_491]|nr:hypothetical protein GQ53DRAFT_819421 [Thozetella sp. PMI_491]